MQSEDAILLWLAAIGCVVMLGIVMLVGMI
jgi:tetrahydromethanopterin S-methyltransferase subunit D